MYRDDLAIDFNPMTVSMDCGGVFYKLNYISGPLDDDEKTGINILESTIESELEDRYWIGEHKIKITGYNGLRDPESPYGDEGVFLNIVSEVITITIIDPCTATEINSNTEFPSQFIIPTGGI